MGTLLDVINTVKDAVNSSDGMVKKLARGKQYSSISQRASEGILQFPVLISNSIDIETAQNISKALERNYTTFAQVVFSMSPTFEYKKDMDVADYIKQFHQNMNTINKPSDILGVIDNYNIFENDDIIVMSATYESATSTLKIINKDQLGSVLDHLRQDILNNKYKPRTEVIYNFSNPELNKKYNCPVTEVSSMDRYEKSMKNNMDINKGFSTRDMLKDNDVKKANELIATTLHIKIKLVNADGLSVDTLDFIIGIKATMHVIKSDEMITNMVNACKNNDSVFNFIRWTTGEISFFKDFLLNIKEMKQDVAYRSKGASPWWIALKRRKSLANIRDSMIIGKKILPNASIVMSAEEVEYIKTEYGFDLFDNYLIGRIMQTYNLLGFCIVDNSSQIAHFIFDNQADMQSVTFSALEKANSSDEKKFKEMLKVINRI